MTAGHERRQYGRIELDEPLRGYLDDIPVRVVEVSVVGFRVEHDSRMVPAPTRKIRVNWEGRMMEFGCVVARSMLFRLAKAPGEKSVYHSGIRILEPIGDSQQILLDFIGERVVRALEEQKANARGLPPIIGLTHVGQKTDRFRRCEFIDGQWRKSESTSSQQPPNGFTIAASVDPHHVDMLCRTYETTTIEGRRLTQMLAELSISPREGGPTRRYMP